MSLMQKILSEIETEAARKSADALKSAGLIYESEALCEALRQHGCPDVEPTFVSADNIIFYDRNINGEMRKAIAAAGLKIASEKVLQSIYQVPNTRTVELHLEGLAARIWLCAEPLPLAMAA